MGMLKIAQALEPDRAVQSGPLPLARVLERHRSVAAGGEGWWWHDRKARHTPRDGGGVRSCVTGVHAKNKIAGRMTPVLVLGFWNKNTVMCAGVMPYHSDFPANTRTKAFQA